MEDLKTFVQPMASILDGSITAWVEQKLLAFVDTYLQSQTLDQYHLSNPVTAVRGVQVH
jgi:hypothetical protein